MEAFSQLEELLLETKMAKVVQQDYRRCNMSKFIECCQENMVVGTVS
jgi:hypothetical protein